MLIIRSEQKDILRKKARRDFEAEMLIHLRKFAPALFNVAGEEQMLKATQLGIKRAGDHGLTYRGPVRLYIELMLLFGSYFDTDPQYAWATEILNARSSGLQMHRADILYERTLLYQQEVAGPNKIYTIEAYKRIAIRAQQPVEINSGDLASTMLHEIKQLYPQKASYIGDAAVEALILEGVKEARTRRFSNVRSIGMIIILMFSFGHGCTDDPLYPWIGRTLKDEAIADPDTRASRLERKALTWLDRVVTYFEKEAQA